MTTTEELYKDLLAKPVEVTGKQNSIPEVFVETAPTLVQLLNQAISQNKDDNINNKMKDDKWYRFGKLSRKRKILTIGKVMSKKFGVYNLVKPYAKNISKLIK